MKARYIGAGKRDYVHLTPNKKYSVTNWEPNFYQLRDDRGVLITIPKGEFIPLECVPTDFPKNQIAWRRERCSTMGENPLFSIIL